MPRNNREWAQRKITSAIGNLEKASGHLLEVAQLYESEKVEYVSKNCYIMIQAMSELPDMLDLVKSNLEEMKQGDYSEIFQHIQGSLCNIEGQLTSITENIKNEKPKNDPIKAKGVIDAIMIINQGLHDLRRIF